MAAGGSDGIAAARAALARGDSALIWRRQIADTDTPISAALKLFEPDRGDYLLESVEGGAVRGRYSLIGLCLLYTSPSPRDRQKSRMPSSA